MVVAILCVWAAICAPVPPDAAAQAPVHESALKTSQAPELSPVLAICFLTFLCCQFQFRLICCGGPQLCLLRSVTLCKVLISVTLQF